MNNDDVAKLSPLKRFLYWIRERHQIYLRRQAGRPNPWTDDEVMHQYFFTNPYRENDKTTVWFREHVRDPLRNDPAVLMATVIFRWYNYIPTGEALLEKGLLTRWSEQRAVNLLTRLWNDGKGQVFTGAYMIKAGNGPRGCKIGQVCKAITSVWKQRHRLEKVCQNDCRLEALWQELKRFKYLGGFMSYEIVCDLRYTALLAEAADVSTWCNLGPGACRGLQRLRGLGIPTTTGEREQRKLARLSLTGWPEYLKGLLGRARKALRGMPYLEMREIEHSLCEWDKYERARLGNGRLKRRYPGVS